MRNVAITATVLSVALAGSASAQQLTPTDPITGRHRAQTPQPRKGLLPPDLWARLWPPRWGSARACWRARWA